MSKTTKTTKVVELAAAKYEDHDDCLLAALEDVARSEGVEVWQCDARWKGGDDGEREVIEVEVRKVA